MFWDWVYQKFQQVGTCTNSKSLEPRKKTKYAAISNTPEQNHSKFDSAPLNSQYGFNGTMSCSYNSAKCSQWTALLKPLKFALVVVGLLVFFKSDCCHNLEAEKKREGEHLDSALVCKYMYFKSSCLHQGKGNT